jgi:hypothetical protein
MTSSPPPSYERNDDEHMSERGDAEERGDDVHMLERGDVCSGDV